MSLPRNNTVKKLLVLIIVGLFVMNAFLFTLNIEPVQGATGVLNLKWSRGMGSNGRTDVGALAANLDSDPQLEIVATGGNLDYSGNNGIVYALDGNTGATEWSRTFNGITPHTPVEIANLDQTGSLEIMVPNINAPMALRADGTTYWQRADVPCGNLYSAVCDVDGDGYPEIFINRHKGMNFGYDYDTMLSYDGTVLRQAWAWHSCWGGFAISDTNFDGRFELYQGDRSSAYSPATDPYKTGGNGLRAFDALTLTPLWNVPDLLCSSQTPVLADVDKDGILDVALK